MEITILVLFTKEGLDAENATEKAMQTTIAGAFTKTNAAFKNSKIDLTVNVCKMVSYSVVLQSSGSIFVRRKTHDSRSRIGVTNA